MTGLDHLPDARDGLTAIERRLLHWLEQPGRSLQASRTVIDRARRQSELTRGEVYDTLVGLVVDFRSRYPLVEGEGNFGEADAPQPDSSLNTEVRLSPLGDALFGAGDRRIRHASRYAQVDPSVPLGGVFPTILANGSADGLASIPPHHLGEVAAAIAARADDGNVGLDRILQLMPGPDFTDGAELVDLDEVRDAYATGRGTVRLRTVAGGQMHVDEEVDVLFVVIVDGTPKQCTLLELIDHYLAHQRATREAAGSTDVDGELKRDLAALAAAYAGERRTRLPVS